MKYDLIVIGGGLAGLALAILEAKAGQRVLLCEQKHYPAHKVCGEYISYESHAFLQHLGLPLTDWALPDIQRLKLTVPNYALELNLPLGGFGLSRHKLDGSLAQRAKAAGVELLEGTKVTKISGKSGNYQVETNSGLFTSFWVAGSWGRRTSLHKQPPQNRNYVGVKWHYHGPLPSDLITLHTFRGGYGGMSRVEDDQVCFCYMVASERLKSAGSIPQLEQQLRNENRHLDEMLAPLTPSWDEPLSISQLSFLPKTRVYEGVLLLGDAAGSIAPLAGNGMSMALHAAWLLHQCWEKYGRSASDFDRLAARYDQLWRAHFELRSSVSYRLQGAFGKVAPATLLFRSVGAFPALGKILARLTHGQVFGPVATK